MYLGSKRFTKEGRDRYGSGIFINDVQEDFVDTIRGTQRNPIILLIIAVLAISKIISANVLGLIITLPLYYVIYFISEKKITLAFTTHRLLYSAEYRYPRWVKAAGNTLIGISVYILLALAYPQYLRPDRTSMTGMIELMREFGISNILIYQYRSLIHPNLILFKQIDQSLTLIANVWFGIQFVFITYEFKEINHSQVSEQLINKSGRTNFFILSAIILSYFLIQFFVINRFLMFLPLIFLFVYQLIPRSEIAKYSIFGPLSRPLISKLEINIQDFIQLERVTAATFGWNSSSTQSNRSFPFNMIPSEVGSIYFTGLRASLSPALKQANVIGLVISILINIIVTISLIRFSILYIPSELDYVLFLGMGLILLSVAIFFAVKPLNYFRVKLQQDEALIIGSSFLGRYIGNTLWIISGNRIQGTSVQRGGGQPLVRYDKIRGLQIAYQRVFVLSILLGIIVILFLWNYAGAINFSSLLLLAPFFFNLGIDFLVEKSTADLSFFLISGYVLWGLILLFYPRLYARNNPTLYLDFQSVSITPIILKDFDDHRDASLDLTKSLINSSRPLRRKTIGRPGWFELELSIIEIKSSLTKDLIFKVGPNQRTTRHKIDPKIQLPLVIAERIRVSGLRGFPSLHICIIDRDKQETIFNETIDLAFKEVQLVNCEQPTYTLILKIMKIGQKA